MLPCFPCFHVYPFDRTSKNVNTNVNKQLRLSFDLLLEVEGALQGQQQDRHLERT